MSCQKLSLTNKDHGGTPTQAAVVGYALVVISFQGHKKRRLFMAAVKANRHEKCTLNDGFFSFAVVRQRNNSLFLFLRNIVKSKCHRNIRAGLGFDRKTSWNVTKRGDFKKFSMKYKYREPGQLQTAPVLFLEDYSVTLICSTSECFFKLFNINAVNIICMIIKNTKYPKITTHGNS